MVLPVQEEVDVNIIGGTHRGTLQTSRNLDTKVIDEMTSICDFEGGDGERVFNLKGQREEKEEKVKFLPKRKVI